MAYAAACTCTFTMEKLSLPLVQQKDTMCILKYGVDLQQWHQIHNSIVTIIVLSKRLPLHGSEKREGESLVCFHISM